MPMDTARKCAISSSVSHGFQVEPTPPDIDRSSLGLVADRVGSPSAVRANTFRKTVGDGRRHVVRHRASEAREPHLLQRVVVHDRACRLSVNGLKPAQGYTRWFSCRTTVLPSTATAVTLSYSGGVPVWPGYGWWRSVNASGAGTLPGSRETPVRGDARNRRESRRAAIIVRAYLDPFVHAIQVAFDAVADVRREPLHGIAGEMGAASGGLGLAWSGCICPIHRRHGYFPSGHFLSLDQDGSESVRNGCRSTGLGKRASVRGCGVSQDLSADLMK